MEENKRSIEAALFIEVSDDENSIEIVSSPRPFSQKGDSQRSSSIWSHVNDVKLKNPASGSILDDDLPATSQWTEWERYKKLKDASNTVIDAEFAELEAWIDEI
jgi:hypothetical protein